MMSGTLDTSTRLHYYYWYHVESIRSQQVRVSTGNPTYVTNVTATETISPRGKTTTSTRD